MMQRANILYAVVAVTVLAGFTPVPAAPDNDMRHSYRPVFLQKLFGKKKPAQGQGQQSQQPGYYIHDDTTFEQHKRTVNIIPHKRDDMEIAIDMPIEWESDNIFDSQSAIQSNDILIDIARFRSPLIGTRHAVLTIQTLRPTYEISMETWLLNHILINGYALDGKIDPAGPLYARASFVDTQNMTANYAYVSAQINNGVILFSRLDVPLQVKDHLSYLQKKIVDSVRVLNQKNTHIENSRAFTLADAFKISYPSSWQISSGADNDSSRAEIRLTSYAAAGYVDGIIGFHVVRRTRTSSLETEIQTFKALIEKRLNIEFVKLLSSGKSPAYDRFIFNRLETYDVQSRQNNRSGQEVHVAVLGDRAWYIIAYLVTSKKPDALMTWGRHTRSFEKILQSMR